MHTSNQSGSKWLAGLFLGLALVGPVVAVAALTSFAPRATAGDDPPAVQGDEPLPLHLRPRPVDAAALLRLFAGSPGFEAAFEEEKHLKLLVRPLKSRGRIYFHPPGHLLRRVTHPEPASVLITPDEMETSGAGGKRHVDFDAAPELREFATSLVRVFAGDLEKLGEVWSVQYTPAEADERGWSLELAPRTDRDDQRALPELVKRLLLRGEGEAVLHIQLEEPNGDRTVTRVEEANPERRYSAEEQLELFGIPLPAPATQPAGGN